MKIDTFDRMDRMYRYQRHIYDLTRKYYLIGRDRLIDGLNPPPGAHILELGCGTGRNLVRLGRRYPDCLLFGVDASAEMLKSAGETLERAGMAGRARLARGLVQDFDPERAFGSGRRFDVVVLSYVLSMVPDWRAALDHAPTLVRAGGQLAVVDFWDQGGWPDWFRKGLGQWLAAFDVTPRPEAVDHLAQSPLGPVETTALFGRYAYLQRLRRPPAASSP